LESFNLNKNNTMKKNISRRSFMQVAPLASLGLAFSGQSLWAMSSKPTSNFGGVQIGTITYSFRSMPHTIDQLLDYCLAAGVSGIEMMGDPMEEYAGKLKSPFRMGPPPRGGQRPVLTEEQKAERAAYNQTVAEWRAHVSMDKFVEIRKKFNKAGVNIYAFKPNAFDVTHTDAEIEYGMRAAKALGAKSVTLELPTSSEQTLRLGKFGLKHKVFVGYHAHLQATDTLWDEALAQSPYNSLNLDCGHYIAVGGKNTSASLLALIEAKHNRISSIHLKDRTTPENGAANLEWGRGNTPIKEILTLLKSKKYKIPVSIELEYQIPEGSDAVKEVKKCVAYAKQFLI
jgi:sugar phosphate isomerase/epimerase